MNLTYKEAGVDIDAGAQLVERIRDCAASTSRPEVLAGLGGFGALTALPAGYRQPVLVSATDGVGTKLRLAAELKRHDGVGLDLVAMCVNDLVVQGAEPLFFLDYYATSRLDVELAAQVIRGIARGCLLAGCALVGGETAEMPGMYQDGDYDLAGFAVGVAERSSLIDGSLVTRGDSLIALASSGPHSNGYSLIRHVLALTGTDPLKVHLPSGALLADVLMEPTRIYVRSLLALTRQHEVHAMAHITGGGFFENLPRVLPAGLCACCERASWQMPEIFLWLREQGRIAEQEMLRTFNCGVGMVVIVPAYEQDAALRLLREHGEQAWLLGSIESALQDTQVRML